MITVCAHLNQRLSHPPRPASGPGGQCRRPVRL